MVRRAVLLWIILAYAAGMAAGESQISAKLTVQNIATHDGSATADPAWFLSGTGTADLSIRSAGNREVKGEVLLRGVLGSEPYVTVEKAYIKARFDGFRLVAGKTALDWGEGFVFNAADLIAGTLPSASLTAISAESFRTATDWLTTVYIPVGRFSFLEAVVLVPEFDTAGEPPVLVAMLDGGAGARAQIRIGSIVTEASYLYNGLENSNNVGLSFQGNTLIDWYVAGTASIDTDTYDADTYWPDGLVDSIEVSFGLFHTIESYVAGSFSFRLEGIVVPGGDWEEDPDADYGVLLYGDAGWSPVSSLAASIRTLYSPIDSSAFLSGGISLSALPGFTTYVDAGIQIGDDSDTFGYGRFGDMVLSGGFRFSY